jgi:hypothetical protein
MGSVSLDNPQTLNLYAYCGNDPINHVDPEGLFFGKLFRAIGSLFKKVAKVFAVVLAVATVLAFSWGFGAAGWVALAGAGVFALIGWGHGKLAQLAAGIAFPSGGYGGFRTPSTFPLAAREGASAAGSRVLARVGAVYNLLAQQSGGGAARQNNQQTQRTFSDCFEKYRFKSSVGALFGPTAESIAEVIDTTSTISFAGDMVATVAKAGGKTLGNPQEYASGLNYVFRRLSRGAVRGRLTTIGGRVLTPAFAVTAVFTATYDLSIAAQCASGVLK